MRSLLPKTITFTIFAETVAKKADAFPAFKSVPAEVWYGDGRTLLILYRDIFGGIRWGVKEVVLICVNVFELTENRPGGTSPERVGLYWPALTKKGFNAPQLAAGRFMVSCALRARWRRKYGFPGSYRKVTDTSLLRDRKSVV